MVAANEDQFRVSGQLIENGLDVEPLFGCGPWSVNQVAEKYDDARLQFGDEGEHFGLRFRVDHRPQFTAPPLGPAVAEVHVCEKNRLPGRKPQRAAGVRESSGGQCAEGTQISY